jgi:fructose-1-phosphate kinase PfkB-like protein
LSSCAACSKFHRGTITALALDRRQNLRKANYAFQNDEELSRFKVDVTNLLAKRSAAQAIAQQAIPQNTGLVRPTVLEYSDLSIKVNASEVGEVIGLDTARDDLDRRALEMLHTYRLRALVITLGSFGAIMATGEVRWHAEGPPVDVVSTVGSGDAFSNYG